MTHDLSLRCIHLFYWSVYMCSTSTMRLHYHKPPYRSLVIFYWTCVFILCICYLIIFMFVTFVFCFDKVYTTLVYDICIYNGPCYNPVNVFLTFLFFLCFSCKSLRLITNIQISRWIEFCNLWSVMIYVFFSLLCLN